MVRAGWRGFAESQEEAGSAKRREREPNFQHQGSVLSFTNHPHSLSILGFLGFFFVCSTISTPRLMQISFIILLSLVICTNPFDVCLLPRIANMHSGGVGGAE